MLLTPTDEVLLTPIRLKCFECLPCACTPPMYLRENLGARGVAGCGEMNVGVDRGGGADKNNRRCVCIRS